MRRLLLSRLLQAACVMLIMSFLITALIGLMPGDPADLAATSDPNLSPADIERIRQRYAVDQPIIARWWQWMQAAVTGDLGKSRLYAKPVLDVVWPALGNTLKLLGLALTLSVAIALPLGILAALKPYSLRDYGINLFAFAGVSIPAVWLGLMLIILFAVKLRWLPASGTGTIDDGGLWHSLRYMVLPVATLTIASVGSHTRFVRGAMIDTLRQDYIRTARSKGAGIARVVFRHALRNAMLPVVTVLALECGALFSGALIVETVFAWPGMGKLTYDAIMGNDYALALVALLLATFITLVGNFLADVTYGWLDPRIRLR